MRDTKRPHELMRSIGKYQRIRKLPRIISPENFRRWLLKKAG